MKSFWHCAVAAVLTCHVGALAWQGAIHGPNLDELGHLGSGLAVWELRRFDLYPVNPPLIRSLAALPVWLSGADTSWLRYRAGPGIRSEVVVADDLLAQNQERTFEYLKMARWSVIPCSVLGALVCCLWATRLYGRESGVVALMLWCFSPNVLAWNATINPDGAAAAVGITAAYLLWNWDSSPRFALALAAGLGIGLAMLSKLTWIVFVAIVPGLVLCRCVFARSGTDCFRRLLHALMILTVSLYVLNMGYLFEGSFQPLGRYTFTSTLLAGPRESRPDAAASGNRFRGTWLEQLPVPVPQSYLNGIDLQQRDFDVGAWSYLAGEWKYGGWWYYYLLATFLKEPLGVCVLLVVRLCRIRIRRISMADLTLLLPAVAVFILVSAETGFSAHLRYVVPCFPFVYVWVSEVFSGLARQTVMSRCALIGLISWTLSSSTGILPHSHSYFNEAAGGPRGGHRYLLDANLDWGEDVLLFGRWCQEHQDARPLYVSLRAPVPLQSVGIEAQQFSEALQEDGRNAVAGEPPSGWYALSVHHLYDRSGTLAWFRDRSPRYRVGYSIQVFHVE